MTAIRIVRKPEPEPEPTEPPVETYGIPMFTVLEPAPSVYPVLRRNAK